MPELAEVEYFSHQWDSGLGKPIRSVFLRGEKRIFRGGDPREIPIELTGRKLIGSTTHGKQMMFRFGGGHHLGIHLGMTGAIRAFETRTYDPAKHDHLVLYQAKRVLVFHDPRLFGRVRFSSGGPPNWWTDLPPEVLSAAFTQSALTEYLARHRGAPLKALLLDQDRFPGVGNWMADEILWRAELHPRRSGGSLNREESKRLWRETRQVCRMARKTISPNLDDPPSSWLFQHRWKDGGVCPRTGTGLVRETIGGRTTCWSPGRQPEPRG